MWRLVPALVREMGAAYPELIRAEALITETLRLEETRFRQTLARGLAILDEESRDLAHGAQLSGETAFRLYDTFGFPLDLTQDALRARGIGVDTDGFYAAMERQRAEARKAWAGSGEAATETLWFAVRDRAGATEFLGYDDRRGGRRSSPRSSRTAPKCRRLETGQSGIVILNQTPFYGESGGQVGDTGVMTAPGRALSRHRHAEKARRSLCPCRHGRGRRDHARPVARARGRSRAAAAPSAPIIRRPISCTRRCARCSAIMSRRRARSSRRTGCDSISPIQNRSARRELAAVEDIANAHMLANTPVVTRLMAVDEAIKSGARALFGEKYGDEVRVVSMGGRDGANRAFLGRALRRHACRAHRRYRPRVDHRRKRGRRRRAPLEAKTGGRRAPSSERAKRSACAKSPRCSKPRPKRRRRGSSALIDERQAPRARTCRRAQETRDGRRIGRQRRRSAGARCRRREILCPRGARRRDEGSEIARRRGEEELGSGVVAIANVGADGKGAIVVGVTPDLTARFNAVDFVRLASERLGGKGGGGRPDMAQAGGPDGSQAEAALQAVEDALRERATG